MHSTCYALVALHDKMVSHDVAGSDSERTHSHPSLVVMS